jgi:hypothetical protein
MVDDSFAIPSHGLESITLPAKQVKSFIFTKKMRLACKRVTNVLNEWDKANQTRQERISRAFGLILRSSFGCRFKNSARQKGTKMLG